MEETLRQGWCSRARGGNGAMGLVFARRVEATLRRGWCSRATWKPRCEALVFARHVEATLRGAGVRAHQ